MQPHHLSTRSIRLAAVAGVLAMAGFAGTPALACDVCGWGSAHPADGIPADFEARANLFNSTLTPGVVPVDTRGGSGGAGGAANLGAGSPQQVWLDFSNANAASRYTAAMQAQVVTGFQTVYTGYDAVFSLTQPTGEFTRIIYDNGGLGGMASEIDFRNLNPSSSAFVGTNFSATTTQRVNYAINVGSHELGHTLGLRHHDGFGTIGAGVPAGTGAQTGFLPDFPGPQVGNEFFFNIMSTPAIGGQQSVDNFLNGRAFLSERSLTKLAFADNGVVLNEQTGAHSTIATAQNADLQVMAVPGVRPAGTANAGLQLPVRAIDVIGSISTGNQSDVYSFQGFAGDFLSVEAISDSINRVTNPVDTIIEVFDSAGNPVNYYGQPALNDQELEGNDSHIFDLILPSDGTYYVEVSSFQSGTGDYELYMWTFGTVPEPTSLSLLALSGIALLRRKR